MIIRNIITRPTCQTVGLYADFFNWTSRHTIFFTNFFGIEDRPYHAKTLENGVYEFFMKVFFRN